MLTDKKIVTYSKLGRLGSRLHHERQKIVLTSGCYDLLHPGHLLHLSAAKAKGDILVVSVGNDQTVRELKGEGRPIYDQLSRARMLAALEIVDYVVISEEVGKMDHVKLVELLKPDIYVLNQDDAALKAKAALVERQGGRLVTVRRTPPRGLKGISTSQIAKRVSFKSPSKG